MATLLMAGGSLTTGPVKIGLQGVLTLMKSGTGLR